MASRQLQLSSQTMMHLGRPYGAEVPTHMPAFVSFDVDSFEHPFGDTASYTSMQNMEPLSVDSLDKRATPCKREQAPVAFECPSNERDDLIGLLQEQDDWRWFVQTQLSDIDTPLDVAPPELPAPTYRELSRCTGGPGASENREFCLDAPRKRVEIASILRHAVLLLTPCKCQAIQTVLSQQLGEKRTPGGLKGMVRRIRSICGIRVWKRALKATEDVQPDVQSAKLTDTLQLSALDPAVYAPQVDPWGAATSALQSAVLPNFDIFSNHPTMLDPATSHISVDVDTILSNCS